MIYHRRPDWALPESAATPESAFLNRRALLAGMGAAAASTALPSGSARAAAAANREPETEWTPAPPTHPGWRDAGRPPTPEEVNAAYNNFYEFGSHKGIAGAAQRLRTDPWTVAIDGLVAKPREIGMEDILARMPIEQRVYRHRCVEAWSMVAPWIGFPLAELVKLAEPTSDARYVRFETQADSDTMPGLRQSWYPWPYVEAVTIEEATAPLAFMVVGAYGKVLHKQFGAPMRLHLPWKYGFKSLKSITRVSFVAERPVGFWEELQSAEYGFWANVNPDFPHPRWTQSEERVLGGDGKIPTRIYNGYGAEVAHLYKDMDRDARDLWY